jgi:hypothetical protein
MLFFPRVAPNLLKPEFLPLENVVVGVEDPGDVLRQVPVQHSLTQKAHMVYVGITVSEVVW